MKNIRIPILEDFVQENCAGFILHYFDFHNHKCNDKCMECWEKASDFMEEKCNELENAEETEESTP